VTRVKFRDNIVSANGYLRMKQTGGQTNDRRHETRHVESASWPILRVDCAGVAIVGVSGRTHRTDTTLSWYCAWKIVSNMD